MTTTRTHSRSLTILGICITAAVSFSVIPAVAVGDDETNAGPVSTFTLDEKNSSGVSGTAAVSPDRVVGTADGFDPDERYVSFFYGPNSQADGPTPCILDGSVVLPSDVNVGEWDVEADGSGTLDVDNPSEAVSGAMSIRRVGHEQDDAFSLPLNPVTYPLVACGQIADPPSPVFNAIDDSGAALPVSIPTANVPSAGAPGVSVPRVLTGVIGG